MNVKVLKPSSSFFLSQTFWKYLRKFINKQCWTYLYKLSQKIKIKKKIVELQNADLNLINNLNYKKKKTKKILTKNKFSYYLKKYNSSKPLGLYRNLLDKLFIKLRKTTNTILEIGVSSGAGIRSMKNYFSNSFIWGVDIDKSTFFKESRIVSFALVDQLKISTLKISAQNFNVKFDLIIDDGWHHPESQINSLIAYLPYLNINGTYIVEDIVHQDYYKFFLKIINNLNKKGFKTVYKKFSVQGSGIVEDNQTIGYLIIKREKNN